MFAHRSRPALLLQELKLHNPTRHEVAVDIDQIMASGWEDAKTVTQRFEIVSFIIVFI